MTVISSLRSPRSKKLSEPKISEAQIQEQVVAYLRLLESQGKILWWTASGNGQWQSSYSVKRKMSREGVRAGMPDLFIVGRSSLLFLELKTKTGRTTEAQDLALDSINSSSLASGSECDSDPHHYMAIIAHSFEEAKEAIDFIL